MTSVKYEPLDLLIVGAFMVALSRANPGDRPTSLPRMMELLAIYSHRHNSGEAPIVPNRLAPDIATSHPGPLVAVPRFEPGADDLGTWIVDGVLKVRNVRRYAALTLFQNTAEHVSIRIPEAENIGELEQDAVNNADKNLTPEARRTFLNLAYYESYIAPGSTVQPATVVLSNVGYYTTRSCRG
jgi:hypothetical protein